MFVVKKQVKQQNFQLPTPNAQWDWIIHLHLKPPQKTTQLNVGKKKGHTNLSIWARPSRASHVPMIAGFA